MKKAFGIMILALLFIGIVLSPARTPTASAASQTAINNAIEKGLAYLNSTQDRSGGSSDGSWGAGSFPVAATAMAVLAFENAPNSHYGWNVSDIYHTTVQKGLDWLFANGQNITIGVQPAGNPDTNGNGIGIGWYGDNEPIYETPMVLMALVASQAPTNVTTTGPANVLGHTYHDIAVDIVDYLAWAQCDAPSIYRGGWRYQPNEGDADNSLSQWPVLGLMAAELWGINATAFVKSELQYWTTYSQNLNGNPNTNYFYGSFDYYPGTSFNSIAESAAGILELTYCGYNNTCANITAAEGYIFRDWLTTPASSGNMWRDNMGWLYAMYAVMKACRLTTPTPIKFIANYTGSPTIEWYNGTGEYADALIANQSLDGHWDQWGSPPEGLPSDLSTAFAVLILEFVPVKVTYSLTVTVVDAVTTAPIAGATVSINGPESRSGTTDGSGNAVFKTLQAGSYQVDASATGYIPSATYTVSVTNDTVFTIALQPLTPVPVGGYSVSLANHASSIQMASYTALISLFAAAVIVVKRKRK